MRKATRKATASPAGIIRTPQTPQENGTTAAANGDEFFGGTSNWGRRETFNRAKDVCLLEMEIEATESTPPMLMRLMSYNDYRPKIAFFGRSQNTKRPEYPIHRLSPEQFEVVISVWPQFKDAIKENFGA